MPNGQDYLRTIQVLHEQFFLSFQEALKLQFPEEYKDVNDINIAGIGGSSFGGRVLISAYEDDELLVPVRLLTGYSLPAYADEKSLVIISSYSGNTEETLKVLEEAVSRGCNTLIITTGGKLKNIVNKNLLPGYVIDPVYNYSGVPRTSIGYSIGSTMGILSNLGYLKYGKRDAEKTYNYLSEFYNLLYQKKDLLEQLTSRMTNKIPVFVSSEHTYNAAHIWRNFMNETAKSMGFVQDIPYMNHHFLDGITHPEKLIEKFVYVFLRSNLYNERNQKRMEITKDIVKKKKIDELSIYTSGTNRFHDIWEIIIIGCFVSYVLSEINEEEPSANPMVDFLKTEINK